MDVFFLKYLHVILILEGTNLKLRVHVQVFAVHNNVFLELQTVVGYVSTSSKSNFVLAHIYTSYKAKPH